MSQYSKPRSTCLFVPLFLILATSAIAQMPRIDPAGIPGAVLVCGGGEVSEAALQKFIDLAGGGAQAKILVVDVDGDKAAATLLERFTGIAKKKELAEPRMVRWQDAGAALKDATGIWLVTKSKDSVWKTALKKQPLGDELLALLKRPGVIATSGGNLDILGENGLKLLLDVARPGDGAAAGQVGIDVSDGATMLIQGRAMSAVGQGSTTISLAASKTLLARTITLQGKTQEDLTMLRRAAFDRQHGFPPKTVEPPVVAQGTLFIVGGGGLPEGLFQQFVESAGGKGKAKIVIFQTAAPDPLPDGAFLSGLFRKAGALKATVLNGRTQTEVESQEFLDTLKEATGLWFSGGRQWRFVDCYENTRALPLMFDVLKRGGAIGGTSAGATIQGDYLCRGGVFDNFAIRYEGYERGLGFLKGVAIDQHFSQRKRHAEISSLMKVYPQYLGIGLDEATAIVVTGSVADVIGKGKVFFYDANRKVEMGDADHEALSAGGRYELKERKVVRK